MVLHTIHQTTMKSSIPSVNVASNIYGILCDPQKITHLKLQSNAISSSNTRKFKNRADTLLLQWFPFLWVHGYTLYT